MALIGTIAASSTGVFNLDFLPEYFLIQDAGSATQSLTQLSVVTSGVQLFSITDVDRLTALAKFDSGAILDFPATAGTVQSRTASWLRLATGRINKATTITGTNGVASARNVSASSTNIGNIARRAVEQSINASANATFNNFECLIFSTANTLRCQITFDNGYSDEFTNDELRALYAKFHVSDQSGNLSGLVCIDSDSGAGRIAQVVIYNGSGGSTVVLKSDYVAI